MGQGKLDCISVLVTEGLHPPVAWQCTIIGGTLLQLSPLDACSDRFKGQLELVTDSMVAHLFHIKLHIKQLVIR